VKVKTEQIADLSMSAEDFMDYKFFVECTVLPNNPTDKLQRMNIISMIKQVKLPIPDRELIEGMGFGNPEWLREKYEEQ